MDIDLKPFFASPGIIHHLESSPVPSITDDDLMLGIDEAGRGPVLGPMVYAAAVCPLSIKKDLENFQDSKTLTEKQRSDLFESINKHGKIGWKVTVLSPTVISNSMLKRAKYNLNSLSHDTAVSLIRSWLEAGFHIKEVYVDTVGPADKYQAKLKQLFPEIEKIQVANKADSLFKIVSVASICAKVIRDHIIENWQFMENLAYTKDDYGSGYPSDPKTKDFLANVFDPMFGYPTFVRFSWSTVSKIMEEKAIQCQWDDDENEEDDEQQGSIISYFKTSNANQKPKGKSGTFFTDNNIEQIIDMDNQLQF